MLKRVPFSILACIFAIGLAYPASAQDPSRCLMITYDFVSECRAVSGGFGKSQRDAMRALEDEFNLKLVFALESGQYLGDVGVIITRSGEPVLDVISKGPWFMADLPEGAYNVTATYEGISNTMSVTVGEQMTTRTMKWDPKAVGFEPLAAGE